MKDGGAEFFLMPDSQHTIPHEFKKNKPEKTVETIDLASYLQKNIPKGEFAIKKIIDSLLLKIRADPKNFSIDIKDLIVDYNVALAAAAIGVIDKKTGGNGNAENKRKISSDEEETRREAKRLRREAKQEAKQEAKKLRREAKQEEQENLRTAWIEFRQYIAENEDMSLMIPAVITFAKQTDILSELFIEENVFTHIVRFVISALSICDNQDDMMLSALATCSFPLKSNKTLIIVTHEQIVEALGKTSISEMAELLLCNIVNKSHPKYQVYNACFLYYATCIKLNHPARKLPGIIESLFEILSKEDIQNINKESDNFLNVISYTANDNEQMNAYFFCPLISELLIDDVIPGLFIMHYFCRLSREKTNTIIPKVKHPDFICSLESLSKILYDEKQDEATEVTDYAECAKNIEQAMVNKNGEDDVEKVLNFYISFGHGTIKREFLNQIDPEPIPYTRNLIVPDNVILIKIGRVGKYVLVDEPLERLQNMQHFCMDNLSDFVLNLDKKNNACDVLSPGCALPDILLQGDDKFFSGIYDCTKSEAISNFDTQKPRPYYQLKDVLNTVSEKTRATGHMALLVLIACQETDDATAIALGNNANRHAMIRLSGKYNVMSTGGLMHDFDRESIIVNAYNKRKVQQKKTTPGGGPHVGNWSTIGVLAFATVLSAFIPELFWTA